MVNAAGVVPGGGVAGCVVAGCVVAGGPPQSLKMFRRAGGFGESTGIGLARIAMGNLMVFSAWRRKMVRR